MVIVFKADVRPESPDVQQIVALAESFPGVTTRVHVVQGATRSLTEVYLLGPTHAVPTTPFEEFEARREGRAHHREVPRHRPARRPARGARLRVQRRALLAGHAPRVRRAVRGRHRASTSRRRSRALARARHRHDARGRLQAAHQRRTISRATARPACPTCSSSPASTASSVIAMEVTHESHIDEIRSALAATGNADRRDAADRHAQRAELRAAQGRRRSRTNSGAVQARHGHHARGVAQRLRVRRLGRQPPASSSACAA